MIEREQSQESRYYRNRSGLDEGEEERRHNYFLRRTIMGLFQFFERKGVRWDLNCIRYRSLLQLLREMGYIGTSD